LDFCVSTPSTLWKPGVIPPPSPQMRRRPPQHLMPRAVIPLRPFSPVTLFLQDNHNNRHRYWYLAPGDPISALSLFSFFEWQHLMGVRCSLMFPLLEFNILRFFPGLSFFTLSSNPLFHSKSFFQKPSKAASHPIPTAAPCRLVVLFYFGLLGTFNNLCTPTSLYLISPPVPLLTSLWPWFSISLLWMRDGVLLHFPMTDLPRVFLPPPALFFWRSEDITRFFRPHSSLLPSLPFENFPSISLFLVLLCSKLLRVLFFLAGSFSLFPAHPSFRYNQGFPLVKLPLFCAIYSSLSGFF